MGTDLGQVDVLVIGGGPAGATAGGVLARAGVSVTVVERERFPRPHVGESLQPATMELLERHLGVGEALAAQGFARKYGAVYVWGERRDPWTVLFDPRLEADVAGISEAELLAGDYAHAWQVDRARFDTILLEAAAGLGATVRHQSEVVGVEVDDQRRVTRIRLRTPSGEATVRPGVVLDASGQRCVLGRAMGLTRLVRDLQATATYAYFDGARGVPGPLGRHVQLVVTVPDGWVWFIPISPERTSVGVVSRKRARLSRTDFDAALEAAALPMAGAVLVDTPGARDGLHFARDWSFTHARFAGPNWFLAGDAACFVDPILSGGVDFAVRGAANAALAVLRGRADPASVSALADEYDAVLRKEYRAYLRLARYWYGNNRSVDGLFWEAHAAVGKGNTYTPMRAFVYLTTGHYAADRHFRVFDAWQEKKMFQALGARDGGGRSPLSDGGRQG